MNVRIEYSEKNTKLYLSSLYPVNWDPFVSNAINYPDKDTARLQLNSRYNQISESLNHDINNIHNIKLVSIVNAKIVDEENYIGR